MGPPLVLGENDLYLKNLQTTPCEHERFSLEIVRASAHSFYHEILPYARLSMVDMLL